MRAIKLIIITAVIVTVSMILVLFGYIIYGRVIESDMNMLDVRLTGYADKLRSELEESDDENPSPDIASMKSIRSEYLGSVYFRLADSIGRVVYSNSFETAIAATVPSDTAVVICRNCLLVTSPTANTSLIFVLIELSVLIYPH